MSGWQTLKGKMNAGLGSVAHLFRFVPEGPRRKIRDWLIRVTTPNQLKPYRPPLPWRPGKYPEGVNVYGLFREANGIAQGTRMYARAIEEAGIPRCFIHTDFISWMAKNEKEFDGKLTRKPAYEVNVMHINPDQWQDACRAFPHRFFDGHYNIGVWLWELEKLPESWKPCFDYVDEIWAPSDFIANAVRKAGDKPVMTLHYGIDVPTDGSGREDFGLPENCFLALAMFDSRSYASRKNPMAAIEAFQRAFAGAEDAMLVLKINQPNEKDVQALREQLDASGIRYRLITGRMAKERLNALIACCDVLISLHRSEGFGLPMAEAMCLGTPVIATRWSANTEFMDDSCACLVDCKLIPVGTDYQFAEEGQVWADPDVEQAKEYLLKLYREPETRKEMSEKVRRTAAEKLSMEACGEKIRKRIREIHQRGC